MEFRMYQNIEGVEFEVMGDMVLFHTKDEAQVTGLEYFAEKHNVSIEVREDGWTEVSGDTTSLFYFVCGLGRMTINNNL